MTETNTVPAVPAAFDPSAIMLLMQQMQSQLAAAEARAAAAEAKAIAAKTGSSLIPGVHPLGFNCQIEPDTPENPDSPYRQFDLTTDTVVFSGPTEGEIKGSKILFGPVLSYFPKGQHAWTSARFRRSHDAYLSVSAGASSTKLQFPAGDWLTRSAAGIYWQMIRSTITTSPVDMWYRGEKIDSVDRFIAAVETDFGDWFQDLQPAKMVAKTRYQRGKR